MFPEWTWVVGFWIGAAIGSFLNVVIYRMPRGMALYKPANSFCPKCKHALGLTDLVPLLSWLFSKGRCRHCGDKVSSRYFWVELANAVVWAGIWYQYMVAGNAWVEAIVYALAASTLVAIIFIDIELYIIPDPINAFLLILGLALNAYQFANGLPGATIWGMPTSIAGALVGIGVLWGIAFLGRALFGKDAMGHGDIKMARGIGAILGPGIAVLSFGLAVALGAILGIVQILARKKGAETAEEIDKDAEAEEPETFGSLLKSGLGYVLCIDIVGQFVPKWYESWFGEPVDLPFEEIEEYPIGDTMIPFGPYLAMGAIVSVVFQSQLLGWVQAYLDYTVGK